jgi:phenylacetyl-CoA:acceptor oxidoreductase subunit 2
VAALGAAFLLCQAHILGAAKGIPAWRPKALPSLLIAGGLFEGLGAAAIALTIISPDKVPFSALAALGAALAAANVFLWRVYLAALPGNLPARKFIVALSPRIELGGYLAPAALLVLAWAAPAYGIPLASLAGAAMVLAGAAWKFTLITRAGHFQGFALPKLPQRGSGARAAPALKA